MFKQASKTLKSITGSHRKAPEFMELQAELLTETRSPGWRARNLSRAHRVAAGGRAHAGEADGRLSCGAVPNATRQLLVRLLESRVTDR